MGYKEITCSKILQKFFVKNLNLYFEGLYLLPFFYLQKYETFHWFGVKDIAREQLEISKIWKIREQIIR